MNYVQQHLYKYQGGNVKLASTPEKAGLGPRTNAEKQHSIKAGRLKGQLFACGCSRIRYTDYADLQTLLQTKVRCLSAHMPLG